MYDNAPRDLPLVDVLTRVYIGQASIRADRMSHRRPETGDKGEREGGIKSAETGWGVHWIAGTAGSFVKCSPNESVGWPGV